MKCDMPDLFINAIRNKLELKVYPKMIDLK